MSVRRHRSVGWVPNQHGAWAMLASPLLVGALLSRPGWIHLLLGIVWLAAYFAFFATSVWLKSRRLARHVRPMVTYAVVTAVLGGVLLSQRWDLVQYSPLFAIPAIVGLVAAARRQERSLVAGIATVAACCLMAQVAYDLGGGEGRWVGWLAALCQGLYFVGTVFYVKTLIRQRGNERFWRVSVIYHIIATVVTIGLVTSAVANTWWLPIVFAGLTLRAILTHGRTLKPVHVGIGEMISTTAVMAATVVSLR